MEKRWYELEIKNNTGLQTVYHEYSNDMNIILDRLLKEEDKGKIIGISSCSEEEYRQQHNTNNLYIQEIRDNIVAMENNPFHLDTGLDKKKVHPRYRKYL